MQQENIPDRAWNQPKRNDCTGKDGTGTGISAGRNYVLPVDVEDVFIDVEAHRIQLNGKARVNRVTAEQILKDILEGTTKPSVVRK